MLVQDVVSALGLTPRVMTREGAMRQISGGFVGDVLSHVMANVLPGYAWITVQTHENVVAVASMLEVSCVIVCQREIQPETLSRAQAEGVTLLWSADGAFEVAGKLYQLLCRSM